ncbi:MAG: DUF4934 domain-containing protein [Tannerellaceae bacterium]|nr:DUF4934 domain-containing protein [Tannerellaceae bacterium]
MKKRITGIQITLLSIGMCIVGCTGNTHTAGTSADIELTTPFQLEELKVSDYFNRLRFIPLETPDEGLIGTNPLWKLTDDYLIVNHKEQCLLFDAATGKFLTAVGYVGNDPEGYQAAYGTPDEKNNRLLFRGWDNNLVIYDFSGKYLEKIKLTQVDNGMSRSPAAVYPLSGDGFIAYYTQAFKDEKFRYLFFDAAGDTIASRSVPTPGEPIEMNSIGVFNRFPIEWNDPHVSMTELLDIQGMLFISGKDEDDKSISVMGENPFWQYKDGLYLKDLFNDTIFRIEGTEMIPQRSFRFGENTLPPAERFGMNDEKSIYLSRMMEGEEFLLLRFATSPYNFEKRKDYNGVFNKKTGDIHINRIDHGFKDDVYGFMQLNPVAVSSSGTFVCVLPAEHIFDWIDEHGAASLPRELSHLADIREDDNPVIVLMD